MDGWLGGYITSCFRYETKYESRVSMTQRLNIKSKRYADDTIV